MSAVRPDGVGAPHPEAIPSGRKRPVSIPWREIARRLAEGARPASRSEEHTSELQSL